MSKFDDLSKQIFKENKFLMETSQDFYNTIEDEVIIEDGIKKIVKTKEELIKQFEENIKDQDFVKIDGEYIINKIVLNNLLNKTKYNKLKEYVATDLRLFLLNDFLIDGFEELFESIFKEVIFDGNQIDLVMVDLRMMLKISVAYITMFEIRIKDLKKK